MTGSEKAPEKSVSRPDQAKPRPDPPKIQVVQKVDRGLAIDEKKQKEQKPEKKSD